MYLYLLLISCRLLWPIKDLTGQPLILVGKRLCLASKRWFFGREDHQAFPIFVFALRTLRQLRVHNLVAVTVREL